MTENHLPHHHHDRTEELFDHMPAPASFDATAELMKLLGDPTRLRLFWMLCHCEECPLNLSAMMHMSSPALAHHLKLLRAAGLILSRRDGKEVYYRAADTPCVRALHPMIEQIANLSCPGL